MLLGDASKARERLGWEAEVDFPDLVKMMVEHDLEPRASEVRRWVIPPPESTSPAGRNRRAGLVPRGSGMQEPGPTGCSPAGEWRPGSSLLARRQPVAPSCLRIDRPPASK